jgi:hypothetical protein
VPGQELPSRSGASRDSTSTRELFNVITMKQKARESAETQERVSKAVMERPGIFQLMAQVRMPSSTRSSSSNTWLVPSVCVI